MPPAPKTKAEKAMQCSNDTLEVTLDTFDNVWKIPDCQRPITQNKKIREVAADIAANGLIPGTLIVGVLDGVQYLIDGGHRREAFRIAGIASAYADVHYMYFKTQQAMDKEFKKRNSYIAKMRPDDLLRSMETSCVSLQVIRSICPFVGYGRIRKKGTAALIGMASLLRNWDVSAYDKPHSGGGRAAMDIAASMTETEAKICGKFLLCADRAWGKEPDYFAVWGNLNVTICMWLYRRTVIDPLPDVTRLTEEQFVKCLVPFTANQEFMYWLKKRVMSDLDRAPAYNWISKMVLSEAKNLLKKKKVQLPSPEWAGANRSV